MVDLVEPSPVFFNQYEGTQPFLFSGQGVFPPVGILGTEDAFADLIDNRPVAANGRLKEGQLCPGYVDDFYDRIHITPTFIELGNLVSSQFRTFDVWNGHFVDKLLSSITTVGDETGIILGEPIAPPTVYGALESRTYDLSFFTSGPVSINIEYIFNFPGEFPSIGITGNRAIIFAFAPDWSDAVVERYEWLTQIIEVEEGSETRFRLRENPRRSMEYRMLFNEREKRLLETYMWGWKARVFAVPLWMDCALTTTVTLIGATTIDVVTATYSFTVGQLAIFVDAYNDVEAVEILTVNPTNIILIRPTIIKEWAAGSRIYPALSGRMQENQGFLQPTADIDFGTVKFEFLDNIAIPAVDSPIVYDDSFALDRAPNRSVDLDVSWDSKYGLVDFGIHTPLVDDRAGFPDVVTQFEFAEDTRDDIQFWRAWLHARAGKWSKFYFSSWSRDFTLVDAIGNFDVTIDVEDNLYRDFFSLQTPKRDIAIYTNDGLRYYRRITGAVLASPDVERLTLDAPLGIGYEIAEVKMISFLHPSRLNTDHVELQWDTQEIAQIGFATRVILQ